MHYIEAVILDKVMEEYIQWSTLIAEEPEMTKKTTYEYIRNKWFL